MTNTFDRFFVRCSGCLEITALDVPAGTYPPRALHCDICGANVGVMGRVKADVLVESKVACKCDERCTSARGPLCSCPCGGKNHGAGMLGYIVVDVTVGSVPRLKAATPALEAKARARFAAYTEALAPVKAAYDVLAARLAAGEYIGGADYSRFVTLYRVIRAARISKSHPHRIKVLAEAGNILTPSPSL